MAATHPSANEAPPATPTPARTGRRPPRRQLKWIIGAVVLLAALIGGGLYWHESSRYASTDNAYVQANQVEITAQVAGTVSAVHVVDQQRVNAGDLLFEIDPANSQI